MRTIEYPALLKEAGIDEEDFRLAVAMWNKRKGAASGARVPEQIKAHQENDGEGSPPQVLVIHDEQSVGYYTFKDVDALVKALKKRVEKMKEPPVTLHERTYYARVNKYGHYWMGKGPKYSKNLDWKKLPTWATKPAHAPDERVVKVKVKIEVESG
jgi:hypothetical protein